jgi:hypothetical protein
VTVVMSAVTVTVMVLVTTVILLAASAVVDWLTPYLDIAATGRDAHEKRNISFGPSRFSPSLSLSLSLSLSTRLRRYMTTTTTCARRTKFVQSTCKNNNKPNTSSDRQWWMDSRRFLNAPDRFRTGTIEAGDPCIAVTFTTLVALGIRYDRRAVHDCERGTTAYGKKTLHSNNPNDRERVLGCDINIFVTYVCSDVERRVRR